MLVGCHGTFRGFRREIWSSRLVILPFILKHFCLTYLYSNKLIINAEMSLKSERDRDFQAKETG